MTGSVGPTPQGRRWRELPSVHILGGVKTPLLAADYDDDPGQSDAFHVAPSLAIGTTQSTVWPLVLPADAEPAAEVHLAVRAFSESGPLVMHRVVPPAELVTGAACESAFSPRGASASLAAGLAATGQAAIGVVDAAIADCIEGRASLLTARVSVPRDWRPGDYFFCAGAVTAEGYGDAPSCKRFRVLALSGFATDLGAGGLAVGTLVSGERSALEGDHVIGNAAPTIVNVGNTTPVVAVRVQSMVHDAPPFPAARNLNGVYQVELNTPARGTLPAAAEAHSIGLADGRAVTLQFPTICLRPGESAALDFAVTPMGAVAAGTYSGALEVVAGDGAGCAGAPPSSLVPATVATPATGPFSVGWAPTPWHWFRDTDGDHFGDSNVPVFGPAVAAGTSAVGGDCDDERNAVYPGAAEVPDQIDNDCDGVIDNGFIRVTATASASVSPTPTATASVTPAVPLTPAVTASSTATPAVAATTTPPASGSTGGAPSGSGASSPTPSPTASATPAVSPTTTTTPAPSATVVATVSPSPTVTPSATAVASPTAAAGPPQTPVPTVAPQAPASGG